MSRLLSTLTFLILPAPLAMGATDFQGAVRPILEAHCFDCHGNGATPKGGLNLERYQSTDEVLRERALWAPVYDQVESGQMPPPRKSSQPTPAERSAILAWLRDVAAAPDPDLGARDPGHSVLRRLTRLEYNNTIRDLFGLRSDVFVFPERLPVKSDYFQPEAGKMADHPTIVVREYGLKYPVLLPDAGLPGESRAEHGYSNRGDAMNLSPLLLEKYLAMAQAIVQSPKLARQSGIFRQFVTDPAAILVTPLVPPAGEKRGTVFEATSEFAPNLDLPLQATRGGAATVTYQFRFNVATGAEEGVGGVWNAEARNLTVDAGHPLTVTFGLDREKSLFMTPREPMWVAGFSTAEETSGQSLFTNATPGTKRLNLALALEGGETGEAVIDLALCVLSRRGEQGEVAVAVGFSGGGTHTLTHEIPAGDGIGNTFFSFRAPDGEAIVSLSIDGSKFTGNHVLMDDLGFLTNGGTGDPVETTPLRPMPAPQKRAEAMRRLTALLPRIFRHPVNDATLARYLAAYDEEIDGQASFPAALRTVLTAALTSPEFLYLTRPQVGEAKVRKLDAFELATRLSYFLWAAPPDEPLAKLAQDNSLQNPEWLAGQVRRMLLDSRARELAESFAVQWLRLDQLYTSKPDPKRFPAFYYGQNGKRTLHAPMLVEALLLFETVMVENRSLRDFIDPGYTWVNLKLAQHYGLTAACQPTIKALGLRPNSADDLKDQKMNNVWWRTSLPDRTRGGFPVMAGPLTVTSLPWRTSPVKRGAWLLETLFNRPPQEPKIAFVLKGDESPDTDTLSVRQRFEAHRNQSACSSCHARLDPPGFAMERFDPVGAWRTADGGQSVDARSAWNGQAFDGPAEFKDALVRGQDEFIRGFIEHLLSYALGRKLEMYDRPAVDEIQRSAAADGYRFRSVVTGVVLSYPFRHIRSS